VAQFASCAATAILSRGFYIYLEPIGSLAGVWFALEDIGPQAGRFLVCPKSHLFDWPRRRLKDNVVDAHVPFSQSVIDTIRQSGSVVRCPALRKGDAVIWNVCTIHGSLGTQDEARSRSSITCHAIPASHRFMTLHHHVVEVSTQDLGHVLLHTPRDLARAQYRAIKWCETTFPGLFWWLKKRLRRFEIRFEMLFGAG
jgi:phytanoyl-CoA hydroxylase